MSVMGIRSHGPGCPSGGYRTRHGPWTLTVGLVVVLCYLASTTPVITALDITQCRLSLGMQSGEIPDEAITASSSYDTESVGPANARIRTEIHGGAWCPQEQVSKDVYEYLQVDLLELKVVSLVETQGRFGNGQGQEFADQYLLEYQREDDGLWFRFRNRRGQEIFQGNTNTYIAELREVDPPIIARRIRFIPYSSHPRTVCMRVELYGCTWKDGSVWYDMQQGERRGTEVDLYDFTYDGKVEDSHLSGGLGQLTDGEVGETNFRLDPKGFGIKGYEWVGWRNDTHAPKPVVIVLKFDDVRNFTTLRLHCNNMFSKEVRVFKSARLEFSVGGERYTGEAVTFTYMRDTLIEYARHVIVPLHHRVGRFLKLEMTFDSRWMMISEIQIESEYAVGNFSDESLGGTTTAPPGGGGRRDGSSTGSPNVVQVIDLLPDGKKNKSAGPRRVPPTYDNANDLDPRSGSTTTSDVMNSSREKKRLDEEYIGIIIGALAALILLLFVVIVIIIIRQRQRKYNNNHQTLKTSIEPRHITLDLNDLQSNGLNGKLSNGNLYNTVATSDGESEPGTLKVPHNNLFINPLDELQQRKLPELPATTARGPKDGPLCREYAVPDLTKSSFNTLQPNIPASYTPNIYSHSTLPSGGLGGAGGAGGGRTSTGAHYAASDVLNVPDIQGVAGSNVYSVPNPDLLWTEDLSIMEFPRESLKFIEKLGEGQFGEVHLCEAQHMTDFLGDDFLINRTSSSSMLVAVKTLRRNADQVARADFQKEVKIMSRIKDPNIVQVLGVCTREDPLSVIVEYMKYGDLNQFLQIHVPENTTPKKKHCKPLSRGCLIYMASQIASGMKFLESLNMVHRDLATRNCLVGHHYCIKISDFGMSRSLYSSDYYRIEGRAVLPIRWMAWESVLLGKFSCKTDVWSFGVTLWEILTFARQQPFDGLTDEQVIENCGHYYRNDGLETYLPPPAAGTREVYDLMKECWNRDEPHRPSFREIHMFLQRKNMGYDPKLEKTYHTKATTSPYV